MQIETITNFYLTDACSKKKKNERRRLPPVTLRPEEQSCSCAPLSQCPELESVLKGPKPIQQGTLQALQKATCYPVKQPRDPNVRCCAEFIEPVTERAR